MKQTIFLLFILSISSVFSITAVAKENVKSARPNVILIMTDDQGYGDIRSHGNDEIDTPVLDQLAASGARFDRFYVSPVCAPTRGALLTGRYSPRVGVHGVTRGAETMRASEFTIAEMFKSAKYATGIFGKWHNGAHYPQHPNGQGFDEFVGFCAGHWNNYFDTTLEHNGQPLKTEGYITDVLTDHAIAFIKENRNQPFFCYIPYNAPHSPWQVPDRYYDKYKQRGLDNTIACAYAMVENIDDNIGRLLKVLDQHQLAENTIVLFLTDNGPNSNRYNGNMKGRKGSVDEGGVRVPLFIRYPGKIKPRTLVKPIAAHIDILPTLAELCSINLPADLKLDGRSLAPLLDKSETNWASRNLYTFRVRSGTNPKSPNAAVRTERWRAVRNNLKQGWKLYDMLNDPSQKNNIAGKHPEVVKTLSAAFEAQLRDVTKHGSDPIPTEIGHPEASAVSLPGHEALLHPGIKKGVSYHGRAGWANDWIDNWTKRDSYPYWPVKVVQPGTYQLALDLRYTPEQVGTEFEIEVAGKSIKHKLQAPAKSDVKIPSPDRVERKEVYEYQWTRITVGQLSIPAGVTQLKIKARNTPSGQMPKIKTVIIRKSQ